MEVEHLIPEAMGGETVEENLWLSCRRCNGSKGARAHATDPVTQAEVAIFNPRDQSWGDHFGWSEDGTRILGKTAIGRATAAALRMNDPLIVAARERWTRGGWWPPKD